MTLQCCLLLLANREVNYPTVLILRNSTLFNTLGKVVRSTLPLTPPTGQPTKGERACELLVRAKLIMSPPNGTIDDNCHYSEDMLVGNPTHIPP